LRFRLLTTHFQHSHHCRDVFSRASQLSQPELSQIAGIRIAEYLHYAGGITSAGRHTPAITAVAAISLADDISAFSVLPQNSQSGHYAISAARYWKY